MRGRSCVERMAQEDEEGKRAEYIKVAHPLMQVSLSRALGDTNMLVSLERKVCRGKPSTDGRMMVDVMVGTSMSIAKSTP